MVNTIRFYSEMHSVELTAVLVSRAALKKLLCFVKSVEWTVEAAVDPEEVRMSHYHSKTSAAVSTVEAVDQAVLGTLRWRWKRHSCLPPVVAVREGESVNEQTSSALAL